MISTEGDASVHLPHQAANRLIMAARMKNVDEFIDKLSALIENEQIAHTLLRLFAAAQGSDRWNLKEKFARLHTIVPGHPVEHPEAVKEIIQL